mmetsp:Transcript_123302/g.356294  ORF Transcript_123302/g.356294 Transcript_123302/m.356294 type:complete len:226 (+) Transcript_123302:1397-2074(+)
MAYSEEVWIQWRTNILSKSSGRLVKSSWSGSQAPQLAQPTRLAKTPSRLPFECRSGTGFPGPLLNERRRPRRADAGVEGNAGGAAPSPPLCGLRLRGWAAHDQLGAGKHQDGEASASAREASALLRGEDAVEVERENEDEDESEESLLPLRLASRQRWLKCSRMMSSLLGAPRMEPRLLWNAAILASNGRSRSNMPMPLSSTITSCRAVIARNDAARSKSCAASA